MSLFTQTLYLAAKTKPLAKVADDGTFLLTLLAYNPIKTHTKDPWRLLWAGQAAFDFWRRNAAHLVPGVQLLVGVDLVRPFDGTGRQSGAEIHAAVSQIHITPRSN